VTDNSNPCAGVGSVVADPESKAAKSRAATKPAVAKIVRAYTLPHFANRSKLEASYGARSASFACTAQCWLSWPSTR
jgi:hypothetical protein